MHKEGAAFRVVDEQLRHRHLARPAIRRAAGRVRGGLHLHALRAGRPRAGQRHDQERDVDPRLHLPRAWPCRISAATTSAHVDPREIVGETGLGSSDEETDEQLDLDLPENRRRWCRRASCAATKIRIVGAARISGGKRLSTLAAAAGVWRQFSDATEASTTRTEGATALKPDTRGDVPPAHDRAGDRRLA